MGQVQEQRPPFVNLLSLRPLHNMVELATVLVPAHFSDRGQ